VAAHCGARKNGRTAELPVKTTAKQSVVQQRTLYWIERNGRLLVWQRPADASLMPGFWELPEEAQLGPVAGGQMLGKFKHGITIYDFRFEVVRAPEPANLGYCCWRSLEELRSAPMSTIFRKAIRVVENQKAGLRVIKASAGG
jgi:A/G-specific adenine glycosylase